MTMIKKFIKKLLGVYSFDREYRESALKAIRLYHKGDRWSRFRANRIHNKNMKKFGCCIPPSVTIGENFYISHAHDIYLAKRVIIGDNCRIYPGAYLTAAIKDDEQYKPGERKSPKIGNNCLIGAGCRVIGRITIGDNVIIGAGAIVTKDVPSDCTVVGINRIIPNNR